MYLVLEGLVLVLVLDDCGACYISACFLCWLAPEVIDSRRTTLWHFSYTLCTSTPPLTQKCVFGVCKTPCTEIWKFLRRSPPGHRDIDSIHVCCFQTNRADKWPKGRVAFLTRPKNFAPFGGTPGAIPHFWCDTLLSFLIYIPRFVQIGSGLGELYGEKPAAACQGDCNIGSFKPIIKLIFILFIKSQNSRRYGVTMAGCVRVYTMSQSSVEVVGRCCQRTRCPCSSTTV